MSEFTSTDPAEILAVVPKYPSREATVKTVQEKYPGHISWASDRANFAGCRIVSFTWEGPVGLEREDGNLFVKQASEAGIGEVFTPAELMNLYFSTRANLLVVQMGFSDGGLDVLVTTQLDNEDLEEFNEVNTRVQLGMREWRETREKQREEERNRLSEERRYAALGRKWVELNLPEKLRQLEAENSKLRNREPENG